MCPSNHIGRDDVHHGVPCGVRDDGGQGARRRGRKRRARRRLGRCARSILAQLRHRSAHRQRDELQRLCRARISRRCGDRYREGSVFKRLLQPPGNRRRLRRNQVHRPESSGTRPQRCIAGVDAARAAGAAVYLVQGPDHAQGVDQGRAPAVRLHGGGHRRHGQPRRPHAALPAHALSALAGHAMHVPGRRRHPVFLRCLRLSLLRRTHVQ